MFDELVVGADPPVWIEDQELETDTSGFATAIDITISELTLEAFLPSERFSASHFQTTMSRLTATR